MGFLSSIKRLLFVKKSVTKSAAEKTADYAKEKGGELTNKAKDIVEDTGDSIMEKTSGLRDAVMSKAEDLAEMGRDLAEDAVEKSKEFAADASDMAESALEKGKDMAQSAIEKGKNIAGDISDKIEGSEVVKKTADVSESVGDKVLIVGETLVGGAKTVSESVGEKVLDTGEKVMDKAASNLEDVGSVVLDKGAYVMDRAKDLSEQVGHKALDAAEDLVAKAKEFAGDMSEKLDQTIENAQKMEAEEALKSKKDFADETLDAEGSLLEDTDDFFSKADKYASGEYDAFAEGKITIKDTDGIVLKASDTPSKPSLDYDAATDAAIESDSKAAGFQDLDGDGNELIDNAIISDESDSEQ